MRPRQNPANTYLKTGSSHAPENAIAPCRFSNLLKNIKPDSLAQIGTTRYSCGSRI